MGLDDSVEDVDDSIRGKDVNRNNGGRGVFWGDNDRQEIVNHGDFLAADSGEGGGALRNVCRLKEKRCYSQATTVWRNRFAY